MFTAEEHQGAVPARALFTGITCVSPALPKNACHSLLREGGQVECRGSEAGERPGQSCPRGRARLPGVHERHLHDPNKHNPMPKSPAAQTFFWSDSNVSLSGAAPNRTPPGRTSLSELLVIFCCCFCCEKGGRRIRDPMCPRKWRCPWEWLRWGGVG